MTGSKRGARTLRAGLLALVASLAALLAPPAPAAAETVIKLATLVPDGSVWDKALRRMGAEWGRATDGRVDLRVYPGGVAGDEPDVIRKMRIGQIQAGTITISGLAEIDPAFRVLGIPLFYDSYEELFEVLDRLEPTLAEKLRSRGFELVHWGHAGWVRLFSEKPIRTIDDLRPLKIFVWAGEDETVQWWVRNGFKPVALAATDIMTGLQTGMIEVLPTTPLAALSLQWFRQTPYMSELGLAPLVGATIVTRRAWERISEADRAAIRATARKLEAELEREIPAQDDRAIREMRNRGLESVPVVGSAEWHATATVFARTMRESMVPPEVYDQALAARDAFRRRAAAEGGR